MKLKRNLVCALLSIIALLSCAPAFAADVPAQASIWDYSLWVEGNNAYTRNAAGKQTYYLSKDGSVYAPLRTVAEWLGKDMSVSADGKTFTLAGNKAPVYQAQLSSSEGIFGELRGKEYQAKLEEPVTVTVRDDASLVLDGNPVSPDGKPVILWDNETYIPVRTAAQLLGMELKYDRYKLSTDPNDQQYGQHIFLRTPLTEEQLNACNAYLAVMGPVAEDCLDFYTNMPMETKADAETTVSQWLAYMHVMKDTPKPDCRLMDGVYNDIQQKAAEAIAACEQVQQQIQQTDDMSKIRFYLREDYTGETYDMDDIPDNVYPLATLCIYPAAAVSSQLSLIINQEIPGLS